MLKMLKRSTSLFLSFIVLASTAACAADTSSDTSDAPDELTDALASDTVDPQGTAQCTIGGVPVSCTDPICSIGGTHLGRGPALGYYSRATCESYAQTCGKRVNYYTTRDMGSGFVHTLCYFTSR